MPCACALQNASASGAAPDPARHVACTRLSQGNVWEVACLYSCHHETKAATSEAEQQIHTMPQTLAHPLRLHQQQFIALVALSNHLFMSERVACHKKARKPPCTCPILMCRTLSHSDPCNHDYTSACCMQNVHSGFWHASGMHACMLPSSLLSVHAASCPPPSDRYHTLLHATLPIKPRKAGPARS